jgi:hypothetical protein
MNLYKIKWKIFFFNPEYTSEIAEFVTKILRNKRYYFLYLKLENKFDHVKITGFSLKSVSDLDDEYILWVYLYNSIDMFAQIAINNDITEIDNKFKENLYVFYFCGLLYTYHYK